MLDVLRCCFSVSNNRTMLEVLESLYNLCQSWGHPLTRKREAYGYPIFMHSSTSLIYEMLG